MTPAEASDKYVELEMLYRDYSAKLSASKNNRQKDSYRRKKKQIRAEQNVLYHVIAQANEGYVARTQEALGYNPRSQTLFMRHYRQKTKK